MLQEPKELIDIGEIGNTATGDILYDGGEKLNKVINALYNTLSDYRLTALNDGIGKSVLHATGYYQKHPRSYYTQPIDIGSLHDINVNDGTLTIRLPKALLGEGVVLANINGSITDKLKAIIVPNVSDSIDGVFDNLTLTKPFTKVTLFCSKVEGSRGIWSFKTESLFGDSVVAVQGSYDVLGSKSVKVAFKDEFKSIKFLLTGTSVDKFKTSEVLVHVDSDNNIAYHTEYAVVKSDNDNVYNISFSIENDFLYANIQTTERSSVSIKSIESIKQRVAV